MDREQGNKSDGERLQHTKGKDKTRIKIIPFCWDHVLAPELDEREQGLFGGGRQSWEQRLTTVTKGEEIGGKFGESEGLSL